MPKGYSHLTLEQRCQIQILKSSGSTQKLIADKLNVSPSTVARELKRNTEPGCDYDYIEACVISNLRKRRAHCAPRKMTQELILLITDGLCNYWSPEQISGRLKLQGIDISHETIYKYIWSNKDKILYKYLRRQGKKYRKRSHNNGVKSRIPNRIDIDERPAIVEEKSRLGDWEGDTIISSGRGSAILTHVERKSKFTILCKLEKNTADNVAKAAKNRLAKFKDKFITATYDNGSEFSHHDKISKYTGAKCYFAKPYKAWERGLNEHTNGLVRQFFPKKLNFKSIKNRDLLKVENLLNNRPRKVLGYKTPREVFFGIDEYTPTIALSG